MKFIQINIKDLIFVLAYILIDFENTTIEIFINIVRKPVIKAYANYAYQDC